MNELSFKLSLKNESWKLSLKNEAGVFSSVRYLEKDTYGSKSF